MTLPQWGSLIVGLGAALIIMVYFIEVIRSYRAEKLTPKAFFIHLTVILGILLGAGEVAGSIILDIIVEEGSIWLYLIGLNSPLIVIGGGYYAIDRLFEQITRRIK